MRSSQIAGKLPQKPPPWRDYVKHVRKFPLSVIPRVTSKVRTAYRRSADWLLPWGRDDYPGKRRGLAQLAPNVSSHTVAAWLKANREPPAWALLALAAHIEARCRAGLALVAELRAEAAKEKPRRGGQGFSRVDPVTGLDGRSKTGRRKVKEL